MTVNSIILVIASRSDIYDKFINVYWKHFIKYTNKNHSNIKIFLIFGKDTKIDDLEELKDNIIITPYDETYRNILEKTLYCFDLCLQKYDFDFLFRTNLSSFIVLNNFINIINNIPKNNYAGGVINNGGKFNFICGAGMLFSKDVIKNLIDNRKDIINEVVDDVDLGKYMFNKIPYTSLPRYDIIHYFYLLSNNKLINILKDILTYNFYHIRLKNYNREVDIQIAKFLTENIYKNN